MKEIFDHDHDIDGLKNGLNLWIDFDCFDDDVIKELEPKWNTKIELKYIENQSINQFNSFIHFFKTIQIGRIQPTQFPIECILIKSIKRD